MTIKDLRSEHSSERVKITKVSIDLSIMLSSLDYVFSEMHKLEEVIPETELASCISSASETFRDCYCLKYLPDIDFSKIENLSRCFCNCRSLESADLSTTAVASDMYGIFENCIFLKEVKLNIENLSIGKNMFKNCSSLNSVEFYGELTVFDGIIDFQETALSGEAFIRMLKSLPNAINTPMIKCTRPDIISELTEEDIKIMTDKNWRFNENDNIREEIIL